jgi:hypothetical protein
MSHDEGPAFGTGPAFGPRTAPPLTIARIFQLRYELVPGMNPLECEMSGPHREESRFLST